MARLSATSGSDPGIVGPLDALVRPAVGAAGLLVAQQVAAKATRDALFLSTFPVTALPLVSAAAAVLSIAGVVAFSHAMARSSPPALVRRVLGLNAAMLAAQWALSLAAPRVAAVTLYLHVGVFGATVLSGFWSVVNERFDPHTARRVVGRIGTGAALGGVAGGLVTWRAGPVIGVPGLLLALAALPVLALLALRRLDAPATAPSAGEQPSAAAALGLIRRHPYLRDVAAVVALTALTEALLEYALNAAVVGRYGRSGALVPFFALYHTGAGVAVLALQGALSRRSLEGLGLAGTLAVPPALVACGAAVAGFVPGFWPTLAVRAAQAVLGRSLFRSGYELLYTPMAPQRKRPLKVLLDVGADRAGTIAGGAVVLAVLLLPAPATRGTLLFLAAGVAALTLPLTRRLHRGYVGALAESVRTGAVGIAGDEDGEPARRVAPPPVPRASRRAPAAGNGPASDAADLRSHDAGRVRAVLSREAPLAPELVPLAITLLARDDLFTETVTALRRVGVRCTGQLLDVLLDTEEDPVVRRRVPRVLKAVPTQRAVDGLLSAIRDERFDVRYRSAQALARLHHDRTLAIPAEAAFAAARAELAGSSATARGLEHVMTLLSLALPGEPLAVALRAWRSRDLALRGTALEYLENVLPSTVWAGLWPWLGSRAPSSSGRTLEEVRDDLLRSTASWSLARRSRSGPA